MRFVRKGAGVIAACVVAGIVAACGSSSGGSGSPHTSSTTSSHKAPKVALILNTANDYTAAYDKGIAHVVTPAGGSVKTFVYNFDPSQATADCKDVATAGVYNAIVLQPVDGPTAVPCVEAAHAAGIPVVMLEDGAGNDPQRLDPTVPGVIGQILILTSEQVKEQLGQVKAACQGINPCNVIGEIASPSDDATNLPLNAMAKVLPNVRVVARFATNYDPAQVVKQLPDELTAHPTANVYFAASDASATAAIPVIKQAGMDGKLKVIASGGSTEGVQAIKDGQMFSTLAGFPLSMGETAARMIIDHLNGQPIKNPGVDMNTLGSPIVLYKSNINQFTPQWGASTS